MRKLTAVVVVIVAIVASSWRDPNHYSNQYCPTDAERAKHAAS